VYHQGAEAASPTRRAVAFTGTPCYADSTLPERRDDRSRPLDPPSRAPRVPCKPGPETAKDETFGSTRKRWSRSPADRASKVIPYRIPVAALCLARACRIPCPDGFRAQTGGSHLGTVNAASSAGGWCQSLRCGYAGDADVIGAMNIAGRRHGPESLGHPRSRCGRTSWCGSAGGRKRLRP